MHGDSEVDCLKDENSVAKKEEDHGTGDTINSCDFLGVSGFALYTSWFFLILVNTLLLNTDISKEYAVNTMMFFFLGEAIASCVMWFASKYLISKPAIRAIAILVIASTSAPSLSSVFSDSSETLLALIWLVAGFGAVCLLSLWGIFLSQLNHKKAILYPAVSMFIEIIIIFGVLYFLRPETVKILMIALPCLSVLLFLRWGYRMDLDKVLPSFCSTRPSDWRSLLHSSIAIIANGFLIGFVAFSLSIASLPSVGLCVLLAALSASMFKIYDARHGQRFEVSSIIKVLAPTAAIGLLFLPFIDPKYRTICLSLMMFVAMTNEVVCWSAVSEYMRVYQLIPFANMAFGRLGDVVGLCCGYFCAYSVFGISLDNDLDVPFVLSIVVIVFTVMQSFFFRDNYTPFAEHPTIDKDCKILERNPPHIGRWKERCIHFARFYNLTPRQQEVLISLAKGYSTTFIKETMVISEHTVKAHVYGIYRKTDVHSRQELIEAIEGFESDDDTAPRLHQPDQSQG